MHGRFIGKIVKKFRETEVVTNTSSFRSFRQNIDIVNEIVAENPCCRTKQCDLHMEVI